MAEKLEVIWRALKRAVTRFMLLVREGVQAWWLNARLTAAHNLAGQQVAAKPVKPVPPHMQLTAADKLNWLVYRYKGSYKILRYGDGNVVVLYIHQDGLTRTSSGLCKTVAEAVGHIESKLST